MLGILLTGVLLGLSAGLAPGPLLTLVITQTLQHDIRAGIKIALAPLITDLPIILFSLFLLSKLSNSNLILGVISIAGALFVSYISYETLSAKGLEINTEMKAPQSFRKGILANALSPHPYLFWISVGSPIMTKAMHKNNLAPVAFLLGFYALLIGSKIALAVLVGKSKSILKGRAYIYTMRCLGMALLVLALLLLLDGVNLLRSNE